MGNERNNGRKRGARRGPGRRPRRGGDEADLRTHLLEAARQAFARHGFRGTTLRQIATRAGVSPAMIHYHFSDKRGLYVAMLEHNVGAMLQRLQSLAASDSTDSLEHAVSSYMQLLAHTPELPALLMRDVLAADAPMRETFIREIASRGAGAMSRIIENDRAAGRLRDDVDPRLAVLSLLSMAAFPFIARPVAENVLSLDYDDAMLERLARHVVRLFYHGVSRQEFTS